jgi:hypothetical protein
MSFGPGPDQERSNTTAQSQINGPNFAPLILGLNDQIENSQSWSEEGAWDIKVQVNRSSHAFLAQPKEHGNYFIGGIFVNETTNHHGAIA